MLAKGVSGGLGAVMRRLVCLLTFCWAVLALCGARSAFGQQPSAAPPDSAGPFSAAGIGTGTRAISGLWQFHLGDDPAWAQPGFDDHGWEQLPADQPWGDAGHPGYAGCAWYRRHITLDPADKTPLALLLPQLGSVAEVYWNGAKAGGVGSLPPHAVWPQSSVPVAVPLPSHPGTRSGELAIRIWQHRLGSDEALDAGGFQGQIQLGYRPLIEKMPQQVVEHGFRTRAVSFAVLLALLLVGVAALVLWTRSRSQWLLLAVAGYLGMSSLWTLSGSFPLSYVALRTFRYPAILSADICFLCLILLIAGLSPRPGIRGARFWWRASLAFLALDLLATIGTLAELQMTATEAHPVLFHWLDRSTEYLSYTYSLYVPVLLAAVLSSAG